MTWIFVNHIHANYQCCIEVNFYFYFGFSSLLLLGLLFYYLSSFGVRVTCLWCGRWQKCQCALQTARNLCLHKCMILPMKMMTMMIPLKNNSQVPTSINVIIYKSKPLNGVIQWMHSSIIQFVLFLICSLLYIM